MAMTSPFVAEIRMFAGNFAPRGWALCDGQLMPLSQNTALFSLIGTFYGGDGKSNFALPDMQGNAPLGQGQSGGTSQYFLGESTGTQTVTLLETEMPAHAHTLRAAVQAGNNPTAASNLALARSSGGAAYFSVPVANQSQQMNVQTLAVAGGSLPHNNMQPYLVLTFLIALQGIFPPRQ
jgi:microcystin-dependent protein